MTWPIIAALAGAASLAFGAALQAAAAEHTPAAGRVRLILALLRRPRWVLGAALSLCGGGLHVLALSAAPLSLVQPLGVSGLLFAVAAAAVLAGRRVAGADLAGALLVTAGLAGLIVVLPHHARVPPELSRTAAIVLVLVSAAVVPAAFALTRPLRPAWRAALLAAAAGTAFGAVSAFGRVLAHAARRDAAALVHWRSAAALALLAIGGLALQHAYRSGRFGLVFAVLLLSDPIAATVIGAVFLDEPLPSGAYGGLWAGVAAAVILPGVVLLSRTHHHPAAVAARATNDEGAIRVPARH